MHKETISKTRDCNANSVVSRLIEQRANREHRAKSLHKQREYNYSKTLDNRGKVQPSSNNFFNDLYAKVKSKVEKEKPPRKKQY